MNPESRPLVAFLLYVLICAALSLCVVGCDAPTAPSRQKVQPVPTAPR